MDLPEAVVAFFLASVSEAALENCSYISAAMDIGLFQPTPLRVCDLPHFLHVLLAILVHSAPPALRALRNLATYGRTNM